MKKSEALRKLKSHADALKALGATSLYLFGSTARNKANAGSDIDLFLDYDRADDSACWIWWRPNDCWRRASASRWTSARARGSIR